MSEVKPTVAIGEEFLTALTALPEKVMKKAKEAITKFRNDPMAPGLNYEKINNVKDPRLRSIRVDRGYRGIVLKPEKGNTYILLWVDKHDEAYKWAERRTCSVNTQTGAIQVLQIEDGGEQVAEEAAGSAPTTSTEPDLFFKFSDDDLKHLGATDEMLPMIRSIRTEEVLEAMQRRFPPAVYDGLFLLACGEAFDTVLEEIGVTEGTEFDPEDFDAALSLDTNKQLFKAITDDAELEEILNEPLAKWRVFLHPSQRKLVEANFNGPARVLGGAGTGKTVVAMHRAKWLASNCNEGEKILFTTFTKSLINDIKNNLIKICSHDELKKIEVKPLDSWCFNFVRNRKYKNEVIYGNHELAGQLWQRAVEECESSDFDDAFLRDEWNKVIQYHDMKALEDYIRVPRPGRSSRLTRLQRKAIWPVFEEYRTLLNEHQLWEPADMFRAARMILESENLAAGFKHLIVDEIQDFHPQAFRLFRAMVPPDQFRKNDLFLVGDPNQNIYGHHIVLSQLGIDIRGRGRRLRLNYRTPDETRKWAGSILDGVSVEDLDGTPEITRGYRSVISGPDPTFVKCKSFEEEITTIREWLENIKSSHPDHVVCLVSKTKRGRDRLADALSEFGIPVHKITSKQHDISEADPVRVATMHRVKGLEFDHMAMTGVDGFDWTKTTEQVTHREKCLLHVAATRTKNSILVTSVNESPVF